MKIDERAELWQGLFEKYAKDLYPERYSAKLCRELAWRAEEILELAKEKSSLIVSHNYLLPEFHELAAECGGFVGDSLGLSMKARDAPSKRIDFGGVYFMAETAKIIAGDAKRVFVEDTPDTIGCSLVRGIDYEWIRRWKNKNPESILIAYINSDGYTKSISHAIATSSTMDKKSPKPLQKIPKRKFWFSPTSFLDW